MRMRRRNAIFGGFWVLKLRSEGEWGWGCCGLHLNIAAFIIHSTSLWSAGSESAVNNSNYCIIAATSIVLNSLWSPQCLWSLTHLIIMPMNVKKGDQSHNFKITWMWTRNQSGGPGKLKTVSKVWECCKCKVWVSPRSMLVVWESPFKCNFPVIAHLQIK